MAGLIVGIAATLLGGVFALFGLYQLLLAAAAFRFRPPGRPSPPTKRVAVLVPAHDEAELIERCVRSLLGQAYPRELYEVIVIADNCTDDTAALAGRAGAQVLVRDDPDSRGKGQALRWALDRLLARQDPPDAVAVVDGDSEVGPDFLEALTAPLEAGAGAAQGESLLMEDGTPAGALRAAAFLLVNRARPAGRDALGFGCTFQGNGILVSTDVLRRIPWSAFSAAEDLEYTITLRLHGIRPRFSGGAVVLSPVAPTPEAAGEQQLRWEGGKLHVARRRFWTLVSAGQLEAALDLAVPPLGLLTAGATAGTAATAIGAATGFLALWTVVPWAVGLGAIPAYVLTGFAAAQAPASAYRSLLQAPVFVLRKLASPRRLLRFRADTWVRTARKP